ncbi:uncharacterized protein RHOBADRAFT_66749, partial [Rhodotorula graminis WP1]
PSRSSTTTAFPPPSPTLARRAPTRARTLQQPADPEPAPTCAAASALCRPLGRPRRRRRTSRLDLHHRASRHRRAQRALAAPARRPAARTRRGRQLAPTATSATARPPRTARRTAWSPRRTGPSRRRRRRRCRPCRRSSTRRAGLRRRTRSARTSEGSTRSTTPTSGRARSSDSSVEPVARSLVVVVVALVDLPPTFVPPARSSLRTNIASLFVIAVPLSVDVAVRPPTRRPPLLCRQCLLPSRSLSPPRLVASRNSQRYLSL